MICFCGPEPFHQEEVKNPWILFSAMHPRHLQEKQIDECGEAQGKSQGGRPSSCEENLWG